MIGVCFYHETQYGRPAQDCEACQEAQREQMKLEGRGL